MERTYICIDLKSFYASVECHERHLDPLNTNLVVADKSRTNKTICLAVSPSLKMYGIPGRPRLFEVERIVAEVNRKRLLKTRFNEFNGSSFLFDQLQNDTELKLDYLVATPRMNLYMEYSARIYEIYLKYIASEDIHVYSIDEVFMDVTEYLNTYKMNAHTLALTMIKDVLKETGITATAGIGTNMYLAKVAMDIVAKHTDADDDGVRIAQLDELEYRKQLWTHEPLTDFWRIGKGIERRLAGLGLYNMGDIARFSLKKEDALYDEFGINAELLIDHAWGWENCLMSDIKKYQPQSNSLSSGQVLSEPYPFEKAGLIVREMADNLSLSMFEKDLVTNQLNLVVMYDLKEMPAETVLKPAHGTVTMPFYNHSTELFVKNADSLFRQITDPKYAVRRIYITALNVVKSDNVKEKINYQQIDLFSQQQDDNALKEKSKKEEKVQKAIIEIRNRYGTNSVIKGMNKEEGATAMERNQQVGGHKA